MNSTMSADQVANLKGREVYDSSGQKIGKVEDFYYDEETGQAEWLGVSAGLFGTKHLLVPVEGIQSSDDHVTVPYGKDVVTSTPDIDDDELTDDHEHELYEHYGLRYQQGQATGAMPPPQPRPEMQQRPETAPHAEMSRPAPGRNSMTRAEEEIRIGKRDVEGGVARLRKWVETKPVEEQVNLRQETARVEREPINQPAPNAQMGDQEIEMRLHREEPVVEKRTVAKERVSLDKDEQDRTETVRGEVRSEHIEAEGAEGNPMNRRGPGDTPGSSRP